MELNTVIWEHSVVGRGGGKCIQGQRRVFLLSKFTWNLADILRIYSPSIPILFWFQSTFGGVWKGEGFFLSLFFFLVFVLFLTIFTVANAFHFRTNNNKQLWKEVGMVCDFGIHGLEHYISWIKCLWVITLQKSQFWGESILWLLFTTTVLCSCK